MADYSCPCCGYLVFGEPPGSYEICPICSWEDDISQLRFPLMGGGANKPNLVEAQRNFATLGAMGQYVLSHVRKPAAHERRDDGWRPLDLTQDNVETLVSGVDYGKTYPANRTALYYWRRHK